jgi:D-tyrosyl-tRNA(Tyr) deacylase
MIAVLQRVTSSKVEVDSKEIASIGKGLNILLCVMSEDSSEDVKKVAQKVAKMRIFPNEEGKFDKSLIDIDGEALVISQFTLAGNIKKGNRPEFSKAMRPEPAKALYEEFIAELSKYVRVSRGEFGANMKVYIENDGPVTIIVDSNELKKS